MRGADKRREIYFGSQVCLWLITLVEGFDVQFHVLGASRGDLSQMRIFLHGVVLVNSLQSRHSMSVDVGEVLHSRYITRLGLHRSAFLGKRPKFGIFLKQVLP